MNMKNNPASIELILCLGVMALIHIAVNVSPAALCDISSLLYFTSLTASDLIPLWVIVFGLTVYFFVKFIYYERKGE